MPTAQRPTPAEPASTHLRLVVSEEQPAVANLGAWTLCFGTLAACAGHGLFLVTALTRLRSLPSRAELGGWLELAVLVWFAAALPLAFLAGLARSRFLALDPGRARALAAGVTLVSVLAFAFYLRAVAL